MKQLVQIYGLSVRKRSSWWQQIYLYDFFFFFTKDLWSSGSLHTVGMQQKRVKLFTAPNLLSSQHFGQNFTLLSFFKGSHQCLKNCFTCLLTAFSLFTSLVFLLLFNRYRNLNKLGNLSAIICAVSFSTDCFLCYEWKQTWLHKGTYKFFKWCVVFL